MSQNKIWIVDPLDGTTDFVNKTGEFTIMIALVENHKPVLGLIYWPTRNQLYLAQKDSGAYQFVDKKWKRITVSNTDDLKKCKAVGSRFHISDQEKKFLKC